MWFIELEELRLTFKEKISRNSSDSKLAWKISVLIVAHLPKLKKLTIVPISVDVSIYFNIFIYSKIHIINAQKLNL